MGDGAIDGEDMSAHSDTSHAEANRYAMCWWLRISRKEYDAMPWARLTVIEPRRNDKPPVVGRRRKMRRRR